MDMNTILIIMAGACLVLYLMKRRSRLKRRGLGALDAWPSRRARVGCRSLQRWWPPRRALRDARAVVEPVREEGRRGFIDVGGPAATRRRRSSARPCERATREAVAKRAAETPRAAADRSRGATPRCAMRWRRSWQGAVGGDAPSGRPGVPAASASATSRSITTRTRCASSRGTSPRSMAGPGSGAMWGFMAPGPGRRAPGADTSSRRRPTVRNTLGTILERSGLCHEALAEYREALRLEPDAALGPAERHASDRYL